MITESKVTEIFCIADDFCKEFEIEVAKNALAESNSKCKFMQPYRKNASLECRSQFSPVDDG